MPVASRYVPVPYTMPVILAVGMLPKMMIKFLIFFFAMPLNLLVNYSFKIYQVIGIIPEIFTLSVILGDYIQR
jgi:hypothetical protein